MRVVSFLNSGRVYLLWVLYYCNMATKILYAWLDIINNKNNHVKTDVLGIVVVNEHDIIL